MLVRRTVMLALVALPCFTGCARGDAPLPQQGIFAGYYSRGFEVSSFRPQGSAEEWWVAWANGDTMPRSDNGYMAVRGSVTNEGSFGHFGVYSRELTVTEVIEFRPLSEEERSAR